MQVVLLRTAEKHQQKHTHREREKEVRVVELHRGIYLLNVVMTDMQGSYRCVYCMCKSILLLQRFRIVMRENITSQGHPRTDVSCHKTYRTFHYQTWWRT